MFSNAKETQSSTVLQAGVSMNPLPNLGSWTKLVFFGFSLFDGTPNKEDNCVQEQSYCIKSFLRQYLNLPWKFSTENEKWVQNKWLSGYIFNWMRTLTFL